MANSPRMRLLSVLLATILILPHSIPSSNAQSLDECKVPDSVNSAVSLGFPVKPERLKYKQAVRLLVIPFYPKGESYSLSKIDEQIFEQSKKDIKRISSSQAQIEFVFTRAIELKLSSLEVDEMKIFARERYLKEFEKDQFGLALDVIKSNDDFIDYSDIDGVVLYGFSKSKKQEIASALQFTYDTSFIGNNARRLDGNRWFTPIITAEAEIANVVLMYNNQSSLTLTHEILHNFGLTDLYGTGTGPGRMSIMSDSRAVELLTYEKWVLGWHPDSRVRCLSGDATQVVNKFEIRMDEQKELILIRPFPREEGSPRPTRDQVNSAYIIETSGQPSEKFLSFYKLENDRRPPLVFYSYSVSGFNSLDLSGNWHLGQTYVGDEFSLLVGGQVDEILTIYLYPKFLTNSAELRNAIAEVNLARAKAEADARAKAEADARAKAEADARAKAEADARAKAEADARAKASSDKAKITCIKGKSIIKVPLTKAKCPEGYRKK